MSCPVGDWFRSEVRFTLMPGSEAVKIRVDGVTIRNFRGIVSLDFWPPEQEFGDFNVLVGANGEGKSSLLASIARLVPLLRGDRDSLFRDADFRFPSAEAARDIEIRYLVSLSRNLGTARLSREGNVPRRIEIKATSRRLQPGINRAFLNDQFGPAVTMRTRDCATGEVIEAGRLIKQFSGTWQWAAGNIGVDRTVPLRSPSTGGEVPHAAAFRNEQMGFADSFRARVVELLSGSSRGEQVSAAHPNLISNVLATLSELFGERRFDDVVLGYSNVPLLRRRDGTFAAWDTLSGGERALFELAMVEEFRESDAGHLVFWEDPEKWINTGLQGRVLDKLLSFTSSSQVFITTHSPGFLELSNKPTASVRHFLVTTEASETTELIDFTNKPVTTALQKLGATSRSVGRPSQVLLVEGLSDAIVFGAILTHLMGLEVGTSISEIVEIIPVGTPNTYVSYAEYSPEEYPGVRAEEIANSENIRLNVAMPGVVRTLILFDSDVDTPDLAQQFAERLQHRLAIADGSSRPVEVLVPWFRTLESMYDEVLWPVAVPNARYRPKEKVTCLGVDRLWRRPQENAAMIWEKPPAKSTLKTRKTKMAHNIATFDGLGAWVREHAEEFAAFRMLAR